MFDKVKESTESDEMNTAKKVLVLIISIVMVAGVIPADVYGATGPDVDCKSAIIYCGDTEEVIWQKNANQKLDPASTTKLLTCLIAVETLELDHNVKITSGSYMPETNIDLTAGEEITVENLLYAMMLHSANDAANALAIEMSGSVDKFAKVMNQKAKALGCTKTNFVNPSGWEHKKHYSTAKDMALITKAALENPIVRKISGTASYTIPKTNKSGARKLTNFNFFLEGVDKKVGDTSLKVKKYEGVFGGKTGTVGKNKNTLAIGLDCDGLEVYCVVLGSKTVSQRYKDMKKLLDYSKAVIVKHSEFEKGADFGKTKLKGGAKNKVRAIAEKNGYINLPEGASASLVTTEVTFSDNLTAPIKKGQKVGVAQIYLAGDLVKTVDLVAEEEIVTGWFLSRFGISNLQTIIIAIVLGLILAGAVTIICLRIKNKRKAQQLRKAKIEEIARRQMEIERDKKARDWTF